LLLNNVSKLGGLVTPELRVKALGGAVKINVSFKAAVATSV
jgi:hypothetical protein